MWTSVRTVVTPKPLANRASFLRSLTPQTVISPLGPHQYRGKGRITLFNSPNSRSSTSCQHPTPILRLPTTLTLPCQHRQPLHRVMPLNTHHQDYHRMNLSTRTGRPCPWRFAMRFGRSTMRRNGGKRRTLGHHLPSSKLISLYVVQLRLTFNLFVTCRSSPLGKRKRYGLDDSSSFAQMLTWLYVI